MPRELVVGETYTLAELSDIFGVEVTEDSRIIVPPEKPRLYLSVDKFRVAWDESDIVFDARLQTHADGRLIRWNGFVVPFLSRAEVDRYIEYVGADADKAEEGSLELARWDDDGRLLMRDPVYQGADEWDVITPSPNGLYAVGGYSWTWYIVSSDRQDEDPGDFPVATEAIA